MMATSDIANYSLFSLLLLIFSTFLFLFIFKKPRKSSAALHFPPSPRSLPIIGHLHHILRRSPLHKSFHDLFLKYGPLLYLRFGSYHCLLVSSPSMAEQIFKDLDVNFAGRPISPLDDCVIFGNDSLIAAPYGDFWRFMKKLGMTELLGTRQIQRSRTVRYQEIARFLRRMIQSAAKNDVVDMGAELMKVTNNIICRVVASISCSDDDDEAKKIQELVKMSVELAGKMSLANTFGPLKKLGFWLYSNKCKDVASRYDRLMEKILKEHEDNKPHKINGNDDLVDVLLRLYHDHTAELRITRQQMKSFLAELLFAGTNTSAETMQWAIAELINHPRVYKIARDEIHSVIGTKTRLVEETDIPNLPYIQAIVKETLRLYPNAPFAPRLSLKHSKIDGFDIPENTPVAVNLYSIMRDRTIWENPDEFCPERFLVGGSETQQQCSDFVPFGGGRRACPGKNLAFALMNIVIASVVQCLDLKSIGEEDRVDMREMIGISVVMASPLRCRPVVHFDPFNN